MTSTASLMVCTMPDPQLASAISLESGTNEDATQDMRNSLGSEIHPLSHEGVLGAHKSNLTQSKNLCNSSSLIVQMPTDVLGYIFVLVVESYRTFRPAVLSQDPSAVQVNNIASVCSHWRHAALNTRRLWSYIDCETIHNFDLAKLWLERAQECSLDIMTTTHIGYSTAKLLRKSAFPLVIPYINSLRSITLFSGRQSIQRWASEWYDHGAPHTLTTLVVSLLGWIREEFPPRGKAVTRQRLDDLLYSVETLHFNNLEVNWDLVGCRNLVTLSLSVLDMHTEAIGQILSTNPKLQYIHLNNLKLRKTSTCALPRAQLDDLHTLEISESGANEIARILASLASGKGSLSLNVKTSLRWSSNDALVREFIELCRRSNVKTLCCDSLDTLIKTIGVVPELETLVLSQIYVSDRFHDAIVTRPDDSQPTFGLIRSRLLNLHTLCFDRCRFKNAEGFQRVVSGCPIREIRMSQAQGSSWLGDDKVDGLEGLEAWVGPRLDLNFSYMPLGWDIGYAPFGVDYATRTGVFSGH